MTDQTDSLLGRRMRWMDQTGTVVHVKEANTQAFIIGAGMKPAGRECTIVYDDTLHITTTPETMMDNGIQHRWRDDEPRLTEDECAELYREAQHKRAEDMKRQRQEADEHERISKEQQAAIRAVMPEWAKAVIVAQHQVDESDIMTDYFHSSHDRTLILAWSRHTRDLFPEFRKAARNAPETAALVEGGHEHREKYSMGRGYYLGEGSAVHATGWIIKKWKLNAGNCPAVPMEDYRVPATEPPAELDSVTDVIVRPGTRAGFSEVVFPDKPTADIRSALKAAGYRWSRRNACWYGKTDRLPREVQAG